MPTVMAIDVTKKRTVQEFAQIFEEHYDLAYRTAYSITRNAEDAEDVVQTIFLRLLRREIPPDLNRNPKGYFYRAAVNISLKTIRSKQRHVLMGDTGELDRAGVKESQSGSQRNAERDANDEWDQRLWQAIAGLHETAAQILVLRYVHDFSLADIAKLLGTSRGTVAVSLFRSRARLKKLIRAPKAKGEGI